MKKRKIQKNSFVFGISFGIPLGMILCLIIFAGLLLIPNIKPQPLKNNYDNSFQSLYFREQNFESSIEVGKINPKKIPIVMYHYVEYITDKNDTMRVKMNTNPYFFERQLSSLNNNHSKTYFVRDVPDILNNTINYSSDSAILTFDDGYADFYNVVYPLLKKYQIKATVYVINNYIGRFGFLNEAQIKEMLNSGLVELGAHTLDHLYLKTISDKVAIDQVVESKKKLEKQFGVTVATFAYPYGAFNKQTVEIVRDAGFVAAVSVIPGTVQSIDNIYYMYRIRPGSL